MKNSIYFRFLLLSVGLALLLGLASMLLLNRFAALSSAKERDRFLGFLAQSVEARLDGVTDLTKIENPLQGGFHPPPPMPPPPGMFRPPGGRPPGGPRGEGPGGRPPPHPALWVVNEKGEILFNNDDGNLPLSWKDVEKPGQVHGVIEEGDYFRLGPAIQIIRLNYPEPLYLVATSPRPPFLMFFGAQAVILFLTVTLAFVLSMSFLFLYLRRKSAQARDVIRRLGQGDLKARFSLKKFDEMSGLLVDFNRMAEQIEQLVIRIRETESTRKNLLQELGHDLRTPLTSLRTAVETLRNLDRKISEEQRLDLLQMIDGETRYFGELLEKLMFVASLDEPQFKSSLEVVDVNEVLSEEIKKRQSAGSLTWSFASDSTGRVLGDPQLLRRLFKNAFDNAARFAQGHIGTRIYHQDHTLEIRITDDGPGLSQEQIRDFGIRRPFQKRRLDEGLQTSMGLGSVIMKSIVDLHGGRLSISNRDDGQTGAILRLELPILK